MIETFDRDVCPVVACRSRKVLHLADTHPLAVTVAEAWGIRRAEPLSLCRACGAFWESWPEGTPVDNVERAQSCGACGNCAYRNSSPESSDAMRREELAELPERVARAIDAGERVPGWFACHKGIPIQCQDGSIEFDYKAAGLEGSVERSCAGFLRLLWRARGEPSSAAPSP